VAGALFEFRNVRLPKTAVTEQNTDNSEAEMEGTILERIFLFEELIRLFNDLFRMFLKVRTSESWRDEVEKIRSWIHQEND
jgi:recombination associated protein RdgC